MLRLLLLIPILSLIISSCAPYMQVSTVKSNFTQNDTLLMYENDTLKIVYNLYADNGLLSFTIYNKTNSPLYVDWKRSALIKGTSKEDYWEDKQDIILVTEGYPLSWHRNYNNNQYSYGIIVKPEQVSFIPPQTAITMARFRLYPSLYTGKLTEKVFPKTPLHSKYRLYSASFSDTTSPLTFRNFLTLSLSHNFNKEFYIDHSFWVSDITIMKHKQFTGETVTITENNASITDYSYPYQKPNNFYIKLIDYVP